MNERQSSPKATTTAARAKPGLARFRVRACLFCGVRFSSAGSHERICGPCKERDEWSYAAAVTKGHTAW